KAAGEWQSFDVVFLAPRFDAAGKKTANARFVKVTHNGQVIHEEVEVTGPTRAGAWEDEKPLGPIMLQGDHGPVAFRNLRVRPLKGEGK
ncbi:MAG TPA: family 16 glycoside hydrolase, partial [Planctomycetota bacterium]|nr:family 16 glycoside hydrolase [Planctomycetota bacterium]